MIEYELENSANTQISFSELRKNYFSYKNRQDTVESLGFAYFLLFSLVSWLGFWSLIAYINLIANNSDNICKFALISCFITSSLGFFMYIKKPSFWSDLLDKIPFIMNNSHTEKMDIFSNHEFRLSLTEQTGLLIYEAKKYNLLPSYIENLEEELKQYLLLGDDNNQTLWSQTFALIDSINQTGTQVENVKRNNLQQEYKKEFKYKGVL